MFPPVICAPEGVGVSGADHVAFLDSLGAVDVDRVVRVKRVSCVWPGKCLWVRVTYLQMGEDLHTCSCVT